MKNKFHPAYLLNEISWELEDLALWNESDNQHAQEHIAHHIDNIKELKTKLWDCIL